MKQRLILTIVLINLFCGSASAQLLGGGVGADSISTALVPAFGYSSNEGFVGGAIFNRYNYKGGIAPFKNYLKSSAIVSTKGFVEAEMKYEQNRSFNRDIRTSVEGYFYRYTTDLFFGVGNNTTFSESQWNNNYYFFRSISFGAQYKLRKPLFRDRHSQFDLQGGLSTQYYIPYERQQQSSFFQLSPNGQEGGWINNLNAGFVWENRDSEFDPTKGNRAELEVRFAPNLISKYAFTTVRLELRQYFQLFNWITFANKLEARHAAGDTPFWELSTLGDAYTLRGYPLNRFKGNSSIAYTLELRTWLFEFPELYNLKFGGQLFTDTGRVFTTPDDVKDLFRGYKQTIGFGGAMSIFTPDFILRGDVGFSEDVTRIYVGVGYLF
ncbi:ShlB/FhaC/HecB family hemolysin secretion/activation protein [Fodinibius saliphilus]|uniref:ShlB/FhaC/HecB family hemolysin secretion/activation protein n=1 Tax=Fodinibius saliphilus TaxID=1920650 RepID=UPI0011098D6F|nr:hypothetical protein [Fodinibius saliphilus]